MTCSIVSPLVSSPASHVSATPHRKAVHFGAGNIGRGFVACFLHNSGYEVVFAEVTDAAVDRLNKNKTYRVIEVGGEGTCEKTITNYRAINSRTHEADVIAEIATADVVTCSVGPNVLRFLAPIIAKGIDQRAADLPPVAVIACENAIGATDTLAAFIREQTPVDRLEDHDKRARYANSAIDRIVPAQDPGAGLDVKLEQFYEWVVDRTPFADLERGAPLIEGVHWVDHLEPYIERKLYTVNTGHATAAYHGYHRKRRTVHDALQDRRIQRQVQAALRETACLITLKHGISAEAQDAYARKIVARISNPHLEDVVERVGRAPLRKLSRKERFIGPAAQLAEAGHGCSALLEAAEMAFRFQNVEGDEESFELGRIMASETPEEVVRKVCGLTEEEKLFPRVVEIVARVQADSQDE